MERLPKTNLSSQRISTFGPGEPMRWSWVSWSSLCASLPLFKETGFLPPSSSSVLYPCVIRFRFTLVTIFACTSIWHNRRLRSFRDDGMYSISAIGERLIPWSEIAYWRSNETLSILCLKYSLFIVVPHRLFTETNSFQSFRAIMESKIGKAA